MKKLLFFAVLLLSVAWAKAQEDMSVVWETKLGHQILHSGTSLEGEHSYAASDKEISLFDNNTGKVIWEKKFGDIAPKLHKIDELIPFWASNTIFLFDRKLGKDQIACINLETGASLWTTDKYQDVDESSVTYIDEEDCFAIALKKELVYIRAQTGEELWSTEKFKGVVGQYYFNGSDHTLTMVNFKPTALEALFAGFKNQVARINLKNGEILWENTYIGLAEKKVISREPLYDLNVSDDKVFLRLNGMQVYHYKTGAKIWSAAFDFTPERVVGKPIGAKAFGVYGAVADPVIDGQDIYLLDMQSRSKQYVKKYDLNTGKLLWTSPEPAARARCGAGVARAPLSQEEGSMLKGSSLASSGRSSIPPGAAKMASAGTALARSMSWAFTFRFSSPVRLAPPAALASSCPSSPVSRISVTSASRFSVTALVTRSTIRSAVASHSAATVSQSCPPAPSTAWNQPR